MRLIPSIVMIGLLSMAASAPAAAPVSLKVYVPATGARAGENSAVLIEVTNNGTEPLTFNAHAAVLVPIMSPGVQEPPRPIVPGSSAMPGITVTLVAPVGPAVVGSMLWNGAFLPMITHLKPGESHTIKLVLPSDIMIAGPWQIQAQLRDKAHGVISHSAWGSFQCTAAPPAPEPAQATQPASQP